MRLPLPDESYHADGPVAHTRARVGDILLDALRASRAQRGRRVGLVAAVAFACGLVVTTLGLSQTASSQVSERFDARRNTQVKLTDPGGVSGSAELPGNTAARLRQVAGIRRSGTVSELPAAQVSASMAVMDEAEATPLFAISSGLLHTVAAEVDWLPGHPGELGPREVVIGSVAALSLGVGSVLNEPVVFIDGVPYAVAGIVREVEREPELLSAVSVAFEVTEARAVGGSSHILIETVPGAAPQVARQAPVAVDPMDPDRFVVDAPVDPRELRGEIEDDVSTSMMILSVVALVVSIVSVGNTMSMDVVRRTPEFGLRRALGARGVHVLGQVTTEATIVGIIGGMVGLYLGFAAILVVTVVERWQPVLDLRLLPIALVSGGIAGVAGGLAAAFRASRIQPVDALRR